NDFINASGLLNGDRKYIVKIQGTYQLPWNLKMSGNYQWLTGRPYASQVPVENADQTPLLNQGIPVIFTETRDGSRRTSNVSLLDLRVEKAIPVNNRWNIGISADIFNIFNSDAFYDITTATAGADDFGQGAVFVQPRRVMVGLKLNF